MVTITEPSPLDYFSPLSAQYLGSSNLPDDSKTQEKSLLALETSILTIDALIIPFNFNLTTSEIHLLLAIIINHKDLIIGPVRELVGQPVRPSVSQFALFIFFK